MSFLTLTFIVFFAVACAAFFLVPAKLQKPVLLAANYVFYMWWRPAFGILIAAGTLISYLCARAAAAEFKGRRGLWITIGVVYTVGVLFVFKYLDFFCQSVVNIAGYPYTEHLGILLPVGVSFFTFAVTGYLLDVKAGRVAAEKNFVDYAIFVSFFPTMLSGPIARAGSFMPQLKETKSFDGERVKKGTLRFAWGAAKKMIAADTLGIVVNSVYADPAGFSGGAVLTAVILYSLQIYFDFSAYSDMAIGASEILGYSVMENFNAPYLTTSVKDFWKRWHISLTSWLRDYIYFPLGGSRKGRGRTYINILIVFAVSGLWHGAAVTFIVWGILNGIYQVAGSATLSARKRLRAALHIGENSRALRLWQMLITFLLISAAWVFFRMPTIEQALDVFARIACIPVGGFGWADLAYTGLDGSQAIIAGVLILPFIAEDVMKLNGRQFWKLERTDFAFWGALLLILVCIFLFGIYGSDFNPQQFVYFQF